MDGRPSKPDRAAVMKPRRRTPPWIRHALGIALLWACAGAVQAAPIYRCTGAHGEAAYRDTPCPEGTGEREVEVAPQPLIGDPGERTAASTAEPRKRTPTGRTARAARTGVRTKKAPVSYECRAGNGEVFYRHTRCPASVPGDGVARIDYSERIASEHSRRRQTAWDRVPVRGTTIPRVEACRRIRAAGAAGRDGHARDEKVSAYDRAMGRDPCDAE